MVHIVPVNQAIERKRELSVLTQVWQSLQVELLKRYRQLEEQMALCYPALQLSPSPAELQELCSNI